MVGSESKSATIGERMTESLYWLLLLILLLPLAFLGAWFLGAWFLGFFLGVLAGTPKSLFQGIVFFRLLLSLSGFAKNTNAERHRLFVLSPFKKTTQ